MKLKWAFNSIKNDFLAVLALKVILLWKINFNKIKTKKFPKKISFYNKQQNKIQKFSWKKSPRKKLSEITPINIFFQKQTNKKIPENKIL